MTFFHVRHSPVVVATEFEGLTILHALVIRSSARFAIFIGKHILWSPVANRGSRFLPPPVQVSLPHKSGIVVDDDQVIIADRETHRIARVVSILAEHKCCFSKLARVRQLEFFDRIQFFVIHFLYAITHLVWDFGARSGTRYYQR